MTHVRNAPGHTMDSKGPDESCTSSSPLTSKGSFLVLWVWFAMAAANWLTLVYCFGHPDNTSAPHWHWFYRLYRRSTSQRLTLFWLILFEFVHGLAIASHTMAVCSDPGTLDGYGCPKRLPETLLERAKVTKSKDMELAVGSRCEKCLGRWKPPRAHHCNRCDKCIFRMDHHCLWIGNCIGQANQKYFILFLTYTIIGTFLNALYFPALWVSCWWSGNCQRRSFWVGTVLVAICVYLGLLARSYLSEMVEALKSNSTLVESYQGTHGRQQKFADSLREVFGANTTWWFLPVRPDIKIDFEEMVWRDELDEKRESATLGSSAPSTRRATSPTRQHRAIAQCKDCVTG
eukprot:Protomagalhaensia_sp_Gyna_25__2759@NODE_258_length_4147_cov_14_802337_g199_i0_p2_GENE_NODE_258_length_4147_cov_14_802337_g199_i0NODE_258_length_4147_cov_14_802337_g199_i0_p2_ORF_typecomplete_len346_score29_94DHHC/PF01529_20/98DHHC/PF01529_20/1_1e28DUF4149/PF13664_6/4_1e03DUF4149/PF13664_6/0_14_NODE_258_length_4147_cov_14_802337_g199_i04911528